MPDPLSDPLARELARLAPAPTRVTGAAVLYAAGQQLRRFRAAHRVSLQALRPCRGGRGFRSSLARSP